MRSGSASLIVAIVGLLVAIGSVLFSAYHQYWKKASLSIGLGERVRSFKSSDNGRLALSLPLTFFNNGAQVGAVVRMTGTLTRPGGSQEVELRWDRFEHAQEVIEGGRFITRFGFGGYTDSVLVQARGAVPLRIQFLSDRSFSFIAGDYRLVLTGYGQSVHNPALTLCIAFTMTPEMVERWQQTLGPEGVGISRGAIEVVWRPCSDTSR